MRSACSSRFGGGVLGAALCASMLAVAPRASAQADAGVLRTQTPPSPTAPVPAEPAAGPTEPPGVMKSLSPGQLSESVRARLQDRAGGHPSGLPAAEAKDRPPTVAAPAPNLRGPVDEPLRRGRARQRRMLAVETAEGVTVLSNRVAQLPEPRLAAMTIPRPSPPEVTAEDEELTAASDHVTTETSSLRAMGARPAQTQATSNVGLGWLLWPFVLFVTTGAVVGTLWFRKKTG